jgi:hypothetical protein
VQIHDLAADDPRWTSALPVLQELRPHLDRPALAAVLAVGAALLRELERRTVEAWCTTIELDSGVQRFDAHRFYLRERFSITSHHFGKPLDRA